MLTRTVGSFHWPASQSLRVLAVYPVLHEAVRSQSNEGLRRQSDETRPTITSGGGRHGGGRRVWGLEAPDNRDTTAQSGFFGGGGTRTGRLDRRGRGGEGPRGGGAPGRAAARGFGGRLEAHERTAPAY